VPDSAIQLVAYADDPLEALAHRIITEQQQNLPDLSHVTVLLAEPLAASRLRQCLLQQAAKVGVAALLGPRVLGLKQWVMQFLPNDIRPCDPHLQLLLLVEALLQHPELIHAANPWALADDLISLFDDLTLKQIGLPEDLASFTQQLQHAYGVQQRQIDALGQEARLVFTLWHAWHQQLQSEGLTDRQTAYLLALSQSLQHPDNIETKLYLAGFHQFQPAELEWLQPLLSQKRGVLILHGQPLQSPSSSHAETEPLLHPDQPLHTLLQQLQPLQPLVSPPDPAARDATSIVLDQIYHHHGDQLQQRAHDVQQQFSDNPLQATLQIYMANHAEDEARAVELQVRLWLLQGRQRIAIVTENRRLARRIRALLERANINLQDSAGWALSTTSAAAGLERWLECLEEDFAHLPLLDLLKSPFVFPDLDRETLQRAALRLQQDIILQENISSGLNRYRTHIKHRLARLPDGFASQSDTLLLLITRLEQAAQPLLQLIKQQRATAQDWLAALQQSLLTLGMDQALANDEAGNRVIQTLEQMQPAAKSSQLQLDWLGFRTWLGRTLEQSHFQPASHSQSVQLLGLSQSRLLTFDALVIAGAERETLPGKTNLSPFFNDAVRRELGLSASNEILAQHFYQFRRLLQSAPRILISARREQNGEAVSSSPWLDAMQAFCQLAWHKPLGSAQLAALLRSPASEVFRADSEQLPLLQQQPRPRLPQALLPSRYSPSSYQQLLDCPYQYFAARGLGLSASEEIRIALSKADYGERVHLCLQAFHCDVKGLPGPFADPLSDNNRTAAIKLLMQIAQQVFAHDLNDNFEHHGWLQQWHKQIPAYLDWQQQHATQWQVVAVEAEKSIQLQNGVQLNGQLDRIDTQREKQLAVIDYKTGRTAKLEEILNGEAVQLPLYALMVNNSNIDNVAQVGYLEFANDGSVSMPLLLTHDQLSELAPAVAQRLADLVTQLQQGKGMPAWGDEKTCNWCDMSLLCRRTAWSNRH